MQYPMYNFLSVAIGALVLQLATTTNGITPMTNRKIHFNKSVTRKPIVLVPGILGSRLQAKLNLDKSPGYFCSKISDWYDIWLNIEEMVPYFTIDCWVYDISMRLNISSGDVVNQHGVKTRVPYFGDTKGFEFLDSDHHAPGSPYFTKLVNALAEIGYKRGYDMKGAPYDWRRTPIMSQDFLVNLTKLIENNYYEHNNQKVVIIGHSMGNMNIYYLLKSKSQAWKDKFIDSFISINAPYIGSVKALKSITSGETEGHDFVLPKLKLRTATRTFPSSFYVLPRPSLWPKGKREVVVTYTKNYTVSDYQELFDKIGCKDCWQMFEKFGEELGDLSAPNVPVHCVYSAQIPTAEVLLYDPDLFPDGTPVLKTGDGDGTVNTFSSSYCLRWKTQQTQPIYDVFLPGNGHVEMLNNKTLHDYIKKVVTSNNKFQTQNTLKLDVL